MHNFPFKTYINVPLQTSLTVRHTFPPLPHYQHTKTLNPHFHLCFIITAYMILQVYDPNRQFVNFVTYLHPEEMLVFTSMLQVLIEDTWNPFGAALVEATTNESYPCSSCRLSSSTSAQDNSRYRRQVSVESGMVVRKGSLGVHNVQ